MSRSDKGVPLGELNPRRNDVIDVKWSKQEPLKFKRIAKYRQPCSRRGLKLALWQWQQLDQVAQITGSKNLTGTRKGNRSWRCLMRRIAIGEVVCMTADVADELLRQRAVSKALPEVVAEPPPMESPPPRPPVKRGRGRPLTLAEAVPAPAHWLPPTDGETPTMEQIQDRIRAQIRGHARGPNGRKPTL